eukprot:TRINITY_DN2401_c0_g1_i15.p1 TRINITY_DN2401_c0_g1~~TRINITY_DN2401_c0_g1_i15.p1  ORF type:complete len:253 (+),score=44.22 TRINITY_DN2401_c0_g1_i15:54-812(+)
MSGFMNRLIKIENFMASSAEGYSSRWHLTGDIFPWPVRQIKLEFGETHDSSAAVDYLLRSGRPGSGLELVFYRTFKSVHIENICRLIAQSPELKSLELYAQHELEEDSLTAILNCLEEACPPLVSLNFREMKFHPDHLGLLGQFVAKAKHLQELSIDGRVDMDSLRVFWDAVVKSESLNFVHLDCLRASSQEFDFLADQLANQRIPNALISMTSSRQFKIAVKLSFSNPKTGRSSKDLSSGECAISLQMFSI